MKEIADALGWDYMPGLRKYVAFAPKGQIRIEAKWLKFFDSVPLTAIPLCLDHSGFLKYVGDTSTHLSVPLFQFEYVVLPYLAKRMELYG